jgi:hypothetical protein
MLKERDERDRKKKERDEKRMKELRDIEAKNLAMKRKEEEEQMSKLEGRIRMIINEVENDATPTLYTLAGVNLGPVRCRIMA